MTPAQEREERTVEEVLAEALYRTPLDNVQEDAQFLAAALREANLLRTPGTVEVRVEDPNA